MDEFELIKNYFQKLTKNNPRVIAIQKIYGKFYNQNEDLNIGKHRFKKFIKDVVNGTIERDEIISEEINNHLNLMLQDYFL